MALRMRLYPTPDPDLGAFSVAPQALKAWLKYAHSRPEVSLHPHWRDLDEILGRAPSAPSPTPLGPTGAHWRFPNANEHGAHALSSESTKRLLVAIEETSRAQIEAYLRQRWSAHAQATGQPTELPGPELATLTDALLASMARLRQTCAEAIEKGYGILMVLEDDQAPSLAPPPATGRPRGG